MSKQYFFHLLFRRLLDFLSSSLLAKETIEAAEEEIRCLNDKDVIVTRFFRSNIDVKLKFKSNEIAETAWHLTPKSPTVFISNLSNPRHDST